MTPPCVLTAEEAKQNSAIPGSVVGKLTRMYDVWRRGERVWGDSRGGCESLDSVSSQAAFYGHDNSPPVRGRRKKKTKNRGCSANRRGASVVVRLEQLPISSSAAAAAAAADTRWLERAGRDLESDH